MTACLNHNMYNTSLVADFSESSILGLILWYIIIFIECSYLSWKSVSDWVLLKILNYRGDLLTSCIITVGLLWVTCFTVYLRCTCTYQLRFTTRRLKLRSDDMEPGRSMCYLVILHLTPPTVGASTNIWCSSPAPFLNPFFSDLITLRIPTSPSHRLDSDQKAFFHHCNSPSIILAALAVVIHSQPTLHHHLLDHLSLYAGINCNPRSILATTWLHTYLRTIAPHRNFSTICVSLPRVYTVQNTFHSESSTGRPYFPSHKLYIIHWSTYRRDQWNDLRFIYYFSPGWRVLRDMYNAHRGMVPAPNNRLTELLDQVRAEFESQQSRNGEYEQNSTFAKSRYNVWQPLSAFLVPLLHLP